jgi:histone-lysine N-methyltransferase SETD1
MSRASAAGFSDFFPAAPRAAKNRAKERERAKSRSADLPQKESDSIQQNGVIARKSRDEADSANGVAVAINHHTPDVAMTGMDGADETAQGDLLNCVRSTSSVTSTVSSVFDQTQQHFGSTAAILQSTLTPLTNDDSSPIGRALSPQRSKRSFSYPAPKIDADQIPSGHVPSTHTSSQPITSKPPRIPMRDTSKPKGSKAINEHEKDKKGRPRAPKYKDITWVCKHKAGERHLRVALIANLCVG